MLFLPCPSVQTCCSTYSRIRRFKIILLEALTVLHILLHVILDGSLLFLGWIKLTGNHFQISNFSWICVTSALENPLRVYIKVDAVFECWLSDLLLSSRVDNKITHTMGCLMFLHEESASNAVRSICGKSGFNRESQFYSLPLLSPHDSCLCLFWS